MVSDRSMSNWKDTFWNPVRGLRTVGALPILAAPLVTLAATGPTIRPAGSVLLGEEEGDRLPVQAREVLKLDHINPALP